jgi:hypothetical protein
MGVKLFSAALALATVPHAGHAAEIIGTRGDWEVFQDSKSCGMTRAYEGPGETEMMVIDYASGEIRVMITNMEWSAKKGELYDISYVLNGTTYDGAEAVGTADRARKGFVSTFAAEFADDLARGSTLHVLLAGKEIERLPLGGTGAAMALVDQCLASLRAALAAAEREKAKRAHLPRDPFAPSPGPRGPIGR